MDSYAPGSSASRAPFIAEMCAAVEKDWPVSSRRHTVAYALDGNWNLTTRASRAPGVGAAKGGASARSSVARDTDSPRPGPDCHVAINYDATLR